MKTITYEDFVSFNPCWLTDEEERNEHGEQLARYRAMRDKWSALDILRLDDVDAGDRLWLVLREELIDAPILHEFGCRCAERALARIDKSDARSVAAIEAKRRWLRGEISDDAMIAARVAARAGKKTAIWYAAWYAGWVVTGPVAWYAAWFAAKATTSATARAAELEWQIAELMRMLEEQE